MEWLKDKKNLPIVAGLGSLVLIIALVAVLFETGVVGGSGGATTATSQSPMLPQSPTGSMPQGTLPGGGGRPMVPGSPPRMPMSSGRPGMPGGFASASLPHPPAGVPGMPGVGATGAPGVPGSATPATTATVPAAPIDIKTGPDPFYVEPGIATTKPQKFVLPVRVIAPPVYIASISTGASTTNPATLSNLNIRLTPQESTTERVSGVALTGNGIHAILEVNGQSQTVQPGDSVAGGKVISIQSDGLIIRTDSGQLVHVPLSGGNAGGGSTGGGYPGGQNAYNTSYPGAP